MTGSRTAERAHLDALMYRMLGGLLLLGAGLLLGLLLVLLALPQTETADGMLRLLPGTDGRHGISATALQYLNRLSDLLFILTRVVNGVDHEILWVPGGDRDAESPTSEGDQR